MPAVPPQNGRGCSHCRPLPIAQQPCCADTAVPALTIPATATSSDAPRSQLGVATAAAQSAPPLPISTPLAKQSQRQLKTPFARLSAWPVDPSARKASQLLKPPEAAVEQPTLLEAALPPALARPLQVTQQGLVSEAGPRSLHVNVLPMRNSKVTPAEAVPPQPGPAGAVSASAAEQAGRQHSARIRSQGGRVGAAPSGQRRVLCAGVC